MPVKTHGINPTRHPTAPAHTPTLEDDGADPR